MSRTSVSSSSSETISPIAAGSQSSSCFSGEYDPDTRSLGDSILDYPVHFDRRYHKFKEGSYPFPNDKQEQHRMEFQHLCLRAAHNNQLFFAPINNPRKVLDVGTGTGIWAIDLADSDLAPGAKIIGVDLSPIQPELVPENVVFEIQDITDADWDRPLASFDFIHSRCLMGSLEDFPQYIRNAKKYLQPGSGWIECCELDPTPACDDDSIPTDWAFGRWNEWMEYGAQRAGRPLRIAPHLKKWMEEAGYVDVQQVIVKIPVGSWPARPDLKRLGKEWAKLAVETLPAASYVTFGKVLGWKREQVEVFLADVRKSLAQKGVHAYSMIYSVYGRRPTPEEEQTMMQPPPRPPVNQS